MIKQANIIAFIFTVAAAVIPAGAHAYQIDTHAFLSDESFDFYNSHFEKKIPEKFRAFFIDGSRREDDAPRWMNHFYDPVHERGLSYDPAIDPTVVTGNWQMSKMWAEDRENQNKPTYKIPTAIASILTAIQRMSISDITAKTDFTWQEAIRHYVNGDMEKAFFTLGHVIHLIQDSSVPAHTRNDPHLEGDTYETFAGKYALSSPDAELEARLGSKMPESKNSLAEYFEGLATYSNNHFYSEDTIGIQTGYSKPEYLEEERIGDYMVGMGKDEDGYYYLFLRKQPKLKIIMQKNDISLLLGEEGGDIVLDDYWKRLSTKSVQYSAGVIDLFFKEAEKAKNDPNFDRGEEKSFLGRFMDTIKFGVQEIGSVVGDVFTSDVPGGSDTVAQNPPPAPDIEIEEGREERSEPEGETERPAEEDSENLNKSDFPADEDQSQNEEIVLLEENLDKSNKTDEPKKTDETEEEVIADDNKQETPAAVTDEFSLCVFDNRRRSGERVVILNEVAWMGTEEGYANEWFELKNISPRDISLSGWQILDYDNEIKIRIPESAVIRPGEFFLLERSDDDSVPEETADAIYKGNLSNDGTKKTEGLRLFDGECALHDEVYADPWWPAGDNTEKRTMERDRDGVEWHTSSVVGGTPKKENSEKYILTSSGGGGGGGSGGGSGGGGEGSPAPQEEYASVKITEIFYDAPGTDDGKEWIEIKNEDDGTVDLGEWKFFEGETNHGILLERGSVSLSPGDFAVIADDAQGFLSDHPSFSGNLFDSSFSLSNDGETIAIRNGTLPIDSVSYASSTGARGDGNSLQKINGEWEAAPPTPGIENVPMNYPPDVAFSITPSEPVVGDFVHFESSSSDPDGTITNLHWEFGDGMATSGTSSVVAHMYADEGFYLATLTATDNGGAIASSSRTIFVASSSSVTSPAEHVVISEILFSAEGSDEGKEFVELYNPLDVDVDLTAWSLAYFVGDSTTSVPIATFGEVKEDRRGIGTKKFFLVGTNGYSAANFGGIEADAVRSGSLPNGSSEWISVALFDSAGTEIDRVRYTDQSVEKEGGSIERKTVVQNACTSARESHEYSGHTCDRGSDGDFEERETPNPQNSLNLKEPRGRLSPPSAVSGETSIGTFAKDSMAIAFSWAESTSTDDVGEVAYRIFDVSAGTVERARTTSTTSSVPVIQVGRTYSFEMYAEDAEGYRSEKTEFVVSAPSFFDHLYAYPDPRTGGGTYLLDMYWDTFPFIPKTQGGNGFQAIVFYKNRSPNENNRELSGNEGYKVPNLDGVLPVRFESCASNTPGTDQDSFIFPLGSYWCSSGGVPSAGAFAWDRLEDPHAIIYTNSLHATDTVSVAYYDRNGSGHFELVAADVTEWHVQEEKPVQSAPELSGTIGVAFNGNESKITLSLPSASDDDSIDSKLLYEINFSPNATSSLDDGLWNATTTMTTYERSVAPGDAFLIGVRARDDFGNLSEIATTTWKYPPTQFFITQTSTDGWSASFGMTSPHTSNEPDAASFQSFSPKESFSFNVVVVKLNQEPVMSDVTTLRLSILGNTTTMTPDFSNVIAKTTLGNLLRPSPDEEKTFWFPSPVDVVSGNTYWLVLDAAGYSDSRGYTRNEWKNAVMSGGSAYADGISGNGHYFGKYYACGGEVVCDFTPNSSSDWYMKIGTRETRE